MGCKPPIIVADYDQSCRIVDRGGDGLLEQRHYTAYVLCKGSSTRPEEKRRAMAQSRALADQLAARLIAHFYRGESGLRHLQADMIEVLDIGATGDQFQGVALRYSILRPRAARIDQSFWAQE